MCTPRMWLAISARQAQVSSSCRSRADRRKSWSVPRTSSSLIRCSTGYRSRAGWCTRTTRACSPIFVARRDEAFARATEASSASTGFCATRGDTFLGLLAHGAGDNEPLDFRRAFVDFKDALIAVKPFRGGRLAVAQTAPDLHGAVSRSVRHFGGIELGHGAKRGDIATFVVRAGGFIKHHACGRDFDRAIGKPKANALVLDDGTAECLPLDRTLRRFAIGRERQSQRLGCNQHASDIECLERKPQGAVHLANARAVRHGHVEPEIGGLRAAQPHLVGDLIDDNAALILVDHEGGDAARTAIRIALRKHHVVARSSAVADPVFLPAESPVVTLAPRGGLNGGGVRAGIALRERKARCHAACHLAEIMLLLIITPGEQDRKGTEMVGAQDCRRRRATARDGLDHGRRRAQACALAAKLLRNEQARESMLD